MYTKSSLSIKHLQTYTYKNIYFKHSHIINNICILSSKMYATKNRYLKSSSSILIELRRFSNIVFYWNGNTQSFKYQGERKCNCNIRM